MGMHPIFGGLGNLVSIDGLSSVEGIISTFKYFPELTVQNTKIILALAAAHNDCK